MNYLGIEYSVKNLPVLDREFIPFGVWAHAYLEEARRPFAVAVEREDGKVHIHRSFLRGEEFAAANGRYVERLVKLLLWSVGGFRVTLCGCDREAEALRRAYRAGGAREFDVGFVRDVYERDMEILISDEAHFPGENESAIAMGGHMNGCRIGFDAGGSDRKVSAVMDGKAVYSEEVVWFPKDNTDPEYHYQGILEALRTAASKMPRVDAIGVSSAGVFVGNRPMVSSLFLNVPRNRREEVKSVYVRAAAAMGDVPLTVANDGDVAALAGSLSLSAGSVLGIAMGTSEAAGYVTADGSISGWLNELAFAPVDLNENAMPDEWSSDCGVGCKYFSQDAVIKLASAAGISPDGNSPAERLKAVQALADKGHQGALDVFRSVGAYLAHTLVLYAMIYRIRYLLVLGRVTSGAGGDAMIGECRRIMAEEYPELAASMTVMLPDEKTRRVGQSVAAASLPEVR